MILNRFLNSFLVLVFLTLVAYIYNIYVVDVYDYWFYSNEPILSLYVYYFVIAIIAFFIPKYQSKPSDFLAWIFFFLVSLPTVSLSPYVADSFYTGSIACSILLISNSLIFCVSSIKEYKLIPRFKGFSLIDLKYFVVFFSLFLIVLVYLNFGFNIKTLLDLSIFTDTYEIRADFRDVKSGIGALSSYSIYWLAKFFLPFFICYGLAFKNKKYIYIGILLQLLVFTVSAHKSFVFSALLVFIVYFLLLKKYSFTQWLASTNLFLFLSVILYNFLNIDLLINMFVRRAFVMPGVLSNWWVNYFSINDFSYFQGSFLGDFFHSNSQLRAPFLIGLHYFGNDWTSANANFVVDAYGNAGIKGVVFTVLIVLFILLILNQPSRFSEEFKIFTTLISIPIFWSFVETSFFIIFVTHGLLILILFMLFLRPFRK